MKLPDIIEDINCFVKKNDEEWKKLNDLDTTCDGLFADIGKEIDDLLNAYKEVKKTAKKINKEVKEPKPKAVPKDKPTVKFKFGDGREIPLNADPWDESCTIKLDEGKFEYPKDNVTFEEDELTKAVRIALAKACIKDVKGKDQFKVARLVDKYVKALRLDKVVERIAQGNDEIVGVDTVFIKDGRVYRL